MTSPAKADVDARARLQQEVDLLPEQVAGCDHASVRTRTGGPAGGVSSPTARRADKLQHELDEGPSRHCVSSGRSVIGHDLSDEPRWTRWCPRVHTELGLGAALAVPLFSGGRSFGVVSLYSDRPRGLSDVDITQLHGLAGSLALALARARREQDGG